MSGLTLTLTYEIRTGEGVIDAAQRVATDALYHARDHDGMMDDAAKFVTLAVISVCDRWPNPAPASVVYERREA